MQSPHELRVVQFGVFELDLRSHELRKHGQKVRLQEQPFQVLTALVQSPGEVVTRDELQKLIWPADTFVDFDLGLNAAIKRLRQALGDSADNPRFVETLPRIGYRLIVPVEQVEKSPVGENTGADLADTNTRRPRVDAASPRKMRLLAMAGIAAVVIGSIAAGWRLSRPMPQSPVIAVLPFKNLSSEAGSDYFSDGLTDEIIRNLSLIEGLEVKSRTSSFEFKDKPRNIRAVGKQLGTSLVLEGSVMRAGNKLRINADLVRVSDDSTIWSERFDREVKDVFAIQDEISRSIVNELRLKNVGGQRRYNTNLEAYDLYLKAQSLDNQRVSRGPQSSNTAIELFEKVIAKDPNFAPAYAGIAFAYAGLRNPRGYTKDAAEKMRAAAYKAIELDPLLAEAWGTVGIVNAHDLAWGEAEAAFRRSIKLNPNLSRIRGSFALNVLIPEAKLSEAVQQYRKGVELDPLSSDRRAMLAFGLLAAGEYEEAQEVAGRVLEANPSPNIAEQFYGRALVLRGKLNEAIPVFQKNGGASLGYLGYTYAKLGRRAEAEQMADKNDVAQARHRVMIYAGLGNKDRVFDALEELAATNDYMADVYPVFPELALVRHDPRMKEFRRKRNLPWNF